MRNKKRIVAKVNDLLFYNYQVENIYIETYNNVSDENLKAYFMEKGFERNQYCKELRKDLEKLKTTVNALPALSNEFYKSWDNFKRIISQKNEHQLLDEVFKIKQETIDRYNDLLMEINLPLHLCRTLIKQRDSIQANMLVLKREKAFVA